jgi:hypothetical protein
MVSAFGIFGVIYAHNSRSGMLAGNDAFNSREREAIAARDVHGALLIGFEARLINGTSDGVKDHGLMGWLRHKAKQHKKRGEDQPSGESACGVVEGGKEGGAVHSC